MEPETPVHASPQPDPTLGLGSRKGANAKINKTNLEIEPWRINKCGENCVKVGERVGNIDYRLLLNYQAGEGWCSYRNEGLRCSFL